MKRKITLVMFTDPGHGWARYPKAGLVRLGIADKISGYSYQNGANAFLEEDCDLTTLVTALREQGHEVAFLESHTDRQSKIRNFARYTA